MDPDVPLVVPEVNAAALAHAQGDRGQSELHDHGGHAGAQAAPRRRRPRSGWWSPPIRRSPAPAWPGWPSSRGSCIKTVDGAAALTFDGGAVAFPPPITFPDTIAHNVIPLAGHLVEDGSGETNEEQKFRDESRKILGDPRARRRPAPVSGSRCSPATRWPSWPSSTGPLSPERATELLAAPPGVELSRHAHTAAGRRARPVTGGPDPRPRTGAPTDWRCSSAATTCARGRRSMPSRSPSRWWRWASSA